MKKIIIILLLLVGCSNQPIYTSTVLVSEESHLLLFDDKELVSLSPSTEYKAGDLLDITYEGTMLESYPAQMNGVTNIKSKGKKETLVNFILHYLETQDNIKNTIQNLGQCKVYALDIKGLSDPQINALSYVLELQGKEIKLTTLEELENDNKIVETVYEEGLLFQIYIDEPNFEINVFKAGDAAYWTKGTFELIDGVYEYTVTDEAIS